jgi:ribosomal protein S18 acetylase RimI-like enzyme
MKISDYDEIAFLWEEAEGVRFRDTDSREGIEKYLQRNPGLSFVVQDSDKIVGTIMSGHDGRRGYIQHLTVLPTKRQKGIATELLSRCINALKSQGILKSHIHVLSNNGLAKNYWSNRGWVNRTDIEVYSYINGRSENT